MGFDTKFQLRFYPARYDGEGFFSIFPVGRFSISMQTCSLEIASKEYTTEENISCGHVGDLTRSISKEEVSSNSTGQASGTE